MIRRVLGLDLGSHVVKAVELRQTLRGVEVGQLHALRSGPAAAPAATGEPRSAEAEPSAERLRDFLRTHRLPTDYVVSAVAGDRVSTRRLSFPFRDRRRLAQAVPFEVEGQVPFSLEEIVVDWELVGGDASKAEVAATVAPRSEVARLLATLREVGIEPRIVDAEGLVLGNLAALVPLPGSRLLLDLGHRKSTLCLTIDGRPIASRTVPIAGHALTLALARERRVSEAEAERMKCEEGIIGSGVRPDSPAALGVLDRLARELVRTLGSLEPVLAASAAGGIEEITLLGGSARLHRIDDYLSERTGIKTARLSIPPSPTGSPLVAGGDPLIFAPALALALRGTMRARTGMDFRQGEYALRVNLRQIGRELVWTGRLALLAFLLAIVGTGTAYVLQTRRAQAIEGQLAQLYAEAFPGQAVPASPMAAMRDAVRSAHERADFLGVYRGNLSALDVMNEISARVPRELEVVFEELSIDRQVVRIRGYSKSFEAVDRLRTELAGFAPFSDIQVSEIQSDARRGGKSFSVTISLSQTGESG